jgi:hypothetical protein
MLLLPEYVNTQEIDLSGGIKATDFQMGVQVKSIISGAVKMVRTNTIDLPAETSIKTFNRIMDAGRKADLKSVLTLSATIYSDGDVNVNQSTQIITMIYSLASAADSPPSAALATTVTRILNFALLWGVKVNNLEGWEEILKVVPRMVFWMAESLKSAPPSDQELQIVSELAQNLESLASAAACRLQFDTSMIRSALEILRVSAMHSRLRSWTVGQSDLQLYGGIGFLRRLLELQGISMTFNSQGISGQVSRQKEVVLTFPSVMTKSLEGVGGLVSVVVWIAENSCHQASSSVYIISKLSTFSLIPFGGFGHNNKVLSVPLMSVPLISSVLIDLDFNSSGLPLRDQERIIREFAVICIIWSANAIGVGAWDDSACAVLDVYSATNSAGHEIMGMGTVRCSCSRLGTMAVGYIREDSQAQVETPLISLVKWAANVPRDSDELVVTAGQQLQLRLFAVSESSAPWSSPTGKNSPSTLSLQIVNDNLTVGTNPQESVWLSVPAVSEASNGRSSFTQLTSWNLTLSRAWTLDIARRASGQKDIWIHATLEESRSGGRLRRWLVRILDCEVLVNPGDTLDAISTRYGISQRLLFAINPTLATPATLPSLQVMGPARWDCSDRSPCVSTAEHVAGGERLRIGRMMRILSNVSVVDQVVRMGGSLRHVAEQNPGRILVLSHSPLILDVDSKIRAVTDLCVVMHDEAFC